MAPPRKPGMTMDDFAAEIADVNDSTASNNFMLYGEPGCGKTVLLSQLPNSLILGFDPNAASAAKWARRNGIKLTAQLRMVPDRRTAEAAINYLENGGHENYDYVIADGVSILQAKLTQEYAREAYEANPEKRVNAYQPDKPDYFHSQSLLKSLVARLIDLPVSVAFTAHAIMADDEEGESWIKPHIEGRQYKVGNFVNGLMGAVGYMYKSPKLDRKGKVVGEVRRIRWQQAINPDTGVTIMAKDQISGGALGDYTDDITIPELLSAFEAAPGPGE